MPGRRLACGARHGGTARFCRPPSDGLCEQPRHLGAHPARGLLRSLVVGVVRAVVLDAPVLEPLVIYGALVGMLELLCLVLKCFRSESLVLSSFGQCWHGNWPLGACVWACLRIAAPFRNDLPQSGHDTGAAIVACAQRTSCASGRVLAKRAHFSRLG